MTRNRFTFGYFFIGISFFSCVGHGIKSNAKQISRNRYAELDVLRLKGINVLEDDVEYPFVTIKKIDSTHKVIDYWYSAKKHTQEVYTYENRDSDWFSHNSFMSDTGKVVIIKKVYADRIIYLEYEDQKPNVKPLSTIRIFKDNVLISYYFIESIHVKLGLFDPSYLKIPTSGLVQESTHLDRGNIFVYIKSSDQVENFCYHIGDHTLNWWYTYENFLISNKNSCK